MEPRRACRGQGLREAAGPPRIPPAPDPPVPLPAWQTSPGQRPERSPGSRRAEPVQLPAAPSCWDPPIWGEEVG